MTQIEFDNLVEGDKVRLRKNLLDNVRYGTHYFIKPIMEFNGSRKIVSFYYNPDKSVRAVRIEGCHDYGFTREMLLGDFRYGK